MIKKIFKKYAGMQVETGPGETPFDALMRFEDFARFIKMLGVLFVIGLIFILLVIFKW